MTDSSKLTSRNVKGVSKFAKRKTIFTWCWKRKSDIYFVQESHSTGKTETQWKHEWGAELLTCHDFFNSRGVVILIKMVLTVPFIKGS